MAWAGFRTLAIGCLTGVNLLVGGRTAAEPVFDVGNELPPMYLRVCFSVPALSAQVALSLQEALLEFRDDTFERSLYFECENVFARVKPLWWEEFLGVFQSWQIKHDENGRREIPAPDLGRDVKLRVSVQRSQTRWYYAQFTTMTGEQYEGWVELSDNPYRLQYDRAGSGK